MPPIQKLRLDPKFIHYENFDDSDKGRMLALQLMEITINWGRVEYWLYLVLWSVDPNRAEEWTQKFFDTTNRKHREAAIRKELSSAVAAHPDFAVLLEDTLSDLESVCRMRNKLAHGLWRQIGSGKFEVQPLRFERATRQFSGAIEVDSKAVGQLQQSIRRLLNKLAARSVDASVIFMIGENKHRNQKGRHRSKNNKLGKSV